METQDTYGQKPLDRLTNSRKTLLKRCLRAYYYRYELGLVAITDSKARSFGTVMHAAIANWRKWHDADGALTCITDANMDPFDTATALALFRGYIETWTDDPEFAHVEVPFELPLTNPDTNGTSRSFVSAGKIDAIDTTPTLWETKTTGESVAPDSEYWLRLRLDTQVTEYIAAARQAGYEISEIIYDVIRKPAMKPGSVPLLDDDGLKQYVDAEGNRAMNKNGTPRQSAGEGLTLLSRPETPEEWLDRLYDDIRSRPEFYYGRRSVVRLDDDIDEFRVESWQIGQMILTCRRTGRWYRNISRFTCSYCEFKEICLQSITVDPDNPPTGFTRLENPDSELEEA